MNKSEFRPPMVIVEKSMVSPSDIFVNEILPTSSYTAYSENKGEKLAFCTTTTKKGDKLIDDNTLTFVGIHEIAHIMTKSIGHTKEFWQTMKFLLKNAAKIGIYTPID